jgi:D-threo-aldose 1-dehydrogenase
MIERHQLDAVLIAGRHTLLDRSAEEALLPIAAARGVAVVAGGIFNSGILANPSSGRFDYAPADEEIVRQVRLLSEMAAGLGISLMAAALHFVAGDSRIASTLLGAASPAELRECLTLLRAPMPASALQEIAAAR